MMQPGLGQQIDQQQQSMPPHQFPPSQYQQMQQQPWAMMAPQPQYHQPPMPPQMWTQQPSQLPSAQVIPQPQQMGYQIAAQPQVQYQTPATLPTVSPQPGASDDIRTLWIGDLLYWMEESYLHSCFAGTGEVVSTKIIRNKQTGVSEGYGFIEFVNRAAADRVLQTYNGQPMPSAEQVFRLNWASYGAGERKSEESGDFTIFVGDLAADVTDYVLQETFRSHYSSVKGAKVVMDRATGRSKGYGFVKFSDVNEQTRAMTEMNGVLCSTRPMRIGAAATKKPTASYPTSQTDSDQSNTTIFVGGVDPSVNDELLRQVFGQYGELNSVKIPVGKRCAFVQFATRASAEEAMLALNGAQLGGQSVRLSWGRKPGQQDSSQMGGGSHYGYGQGYEAAGSYANAPASAAYGAYATYPSYPGYPQQPQPSQQ